MSKGFTNIVSMMLMIMLVIGLSAAFVAWGGPTIESLMDTANEMMTLSITGFKGQIRLEGASSISGDIYVRNLAGIPINTTRFGLFVNGEFRDDCPIWDVGGSAVTAIPSNRVGGCNLSPPCNPGDLVRITLSFSKTERTCE